MYPEFLPPLGLRCVIATSEYAAPVIPVVPIVSVSPIHATDDPPVLAHVQNSVCTNTAQVCKKVLLLINLFIICYCIHSM